MSVLLEGRRDYRVGMASPAAYPDPAPVPPSAEPQAIRTWLTPLLAAEFDHEWELTLEAAKRSKDLAAVHELLGRWPHIAYLERRDPGAYHRLLTKADQISRTGSNPDAASYDELQALIRRRLGR